MEIRQLRHFIAIAEEGSLSAAAARLGVAQPSLSQLVKTMEARIGVDLVVRSPHGATLTTAGQLLHDRARQIVALVDKTREEVRVAGTDAVGTVSFGLPSSVSMVLSVPLAETVRVLLPKVSLKVVEAMSGFIKDWLNAGEIDLAILYDIDAKSKFQSQLLLSEDLHVFAAPDNWPFRTPAGVPVALADLIGLDMILPSQDHGLRAMIDRYCRSNGVALNVVIEMDALAQIKTLVARGSGYCILAPAAAHDMLASGLLASSPIVRPALRRPVYLARSFERPLTRAAKEIEALTTDVVADLVRREIWRASLAGADLRRGWV